MIPARIDSTRFPRKILYSFHNLPMVEHVRRRALLCDMISKVLVATCDQQKSYIKKMLGIIAFRKSTLIKLADLKPSRIEKAEFIEQMRIIEYGFNFRSVPVDHSTPSVNEPNDTIAILETLKNDRQQAALLKKILPI